MLRARGFGRLIVFPHMISLANQRLTGISHKRSFLRRAGGAAVRDLFSFCRCCPHDRVQRRHPQRRRSSTWSPRFRGVAGVGAELGVRRLLFSFAHIHHADFAIPAL